MRTERESDTVTDLEFVLGMDIILPTDFGPDLKERLLQEYANAYTQGQRIDYSKMSPNMVAMIRHLYLWVSEVRGVENGGQFFIPIQEV